MAWARVDDGWWCHPKVMGLSLAASGLWARALSWSCQQRRDVVPTSFLAMVGAGDDLAVELMEAGLWIPVDDGWRINDWADYQELTLSEKRAQAGAKGGKRSGETRRREATAKQDEANERSNDQANGEAGTRPGPSQPDPTEEQEPARPRKRARQLPDGWRPDDVTLARQRQEHPGVDLELELAKFTDHAAANGRTAKDWTAAWRNWVRNARPTLGARASPRRVDQLTGTTDDATEF